MWLVSICRFRFRAKLVDGDVQWKRKIRIDRGLTVYMRLEYGTTASGTRSLMTAGRRHRLGCVQVTG